MLLSTARFFTHSEPSFFLKGGYAMEVRISSARATKDIDPTYLQRIKNPEDSLPTLQRFAAVDLGDYFSYALGEAQLDLDNAPWFFPSSLVG